MDVFKNMVLLWIVFFLGFVSRCSGAVHSDGFEKILKIMKLTNSLELQNLTTLLKNLGLHDCMDKTHGHFHKCVTAVSLFNFFNITTSSLLKERDFGTMAPLILYSIFSWIDNHADENLNFLTRKVTVYEELLERYATSSLCEQVLDQMLRDINESLGKQLNTSTCFSSHDILHEMNISNEAEITKAKLPELSTIIISKLLEKRCIKVEYETPLPCPSYFVNELFNKFSQNNIINKKKLEELLKHLMIRNHEATDGKEDNRDNEKEHNYNRHRRHISTSSRLSTDQDIVFKPYVQERKSGNGRNRRDTQLEKDNQVKNIYKKCYSVDELFSIYQVDEKTGFNIERFQHLSSALLQEIESDVCNTEVRNPDKKSHYVWGYGLAAVTIISLCSIIVIIPTMQVKYYRQILVFLISLAIGTLVGDALLHLLPHATGFHDEHGHSNLFYSDKDKSYLWKFLTAVAGVYGLFFFESTVQLFFHNTLQGQRTQSVEHTPTDRQLTEGEKSPNKTDIDSSKSHPAGPSKQPTVLVNMQITKEEDTAQIEESSNYDIEEKTNHKKHIAPIVWTVIIGDTIHNIADGIAIGVAFSESTFGGISTSIAVLCHEIPHELGDFVVFLESGMSVWQALLANFLSSCFCFLGLILGQLISDIEDVNLYILAITSGFFLYIALTSKLPELMRISATSDLSKLSIILLQNTGILLGFLGMTLLAFYEKDIAV